VCCHIRGLKFSEEGVCLPASKEADHLLAASILIHRANMELRRQDQVPEKIKLRGDSRCALGSLCTDAAGVSLFTLTFPLSTALRGGINLVTVEAGLLERQGADPEGPSRCER